MTFRAILLGALGAVLIASYGYLNDSVFRLTYLVGNHLPISVFGLLILLVLLANPVLRRLHRRSAFRPGELATMVALMLVACSIPGSGLMRTFTTSLAMPFQQQRTKLVWQRTDVFKYIPSGAMPGGRAYDPEVMERFLRGDSNVGDGFPIWEAFGPKVPWSKWAGPLWIWMPLVVMMSIAVIALAVVLHGQWADRERLRYPISEFANCLIAPQHQGQPKPIRRERLFWIGLLAVLGIHVINGVQTWYPESVRIPLSFPLQPLWQEFPPLHKVPTARRLVDVTFYPTAVAFAFFLSSEVAFSLGVSQILFVIVMGLLLAGGVQIRSDWVTGGPIGWQRFGSYVGLGALLLYLGRRYYGGLLRQTFTFRARPEIRKYQTWACRIALVCLAGMAVLLTRLGLEWPFAVLLVLLMVLMFVVIARINAESGLFFIQPGWMPLGVLLGLFGAKYLGPQAILITGLACAVLCIDPRECLMPFVLNGLKICQQNRVAPRRCGVSAAAVFLIALAVSVPVVLWSNYNHGFPIGDAWGARTVPAMAFDATASAAQRLRLSGELAASETMPVSTRLTGLWSPHKDQGVFLKSALIGAIAVLALSVLRLRYTRWPLHPVIFLIWGTYPISRFSHSFLLGWLMKGAVTKFGGAHSHRMARICMVGVIAGDLLGGLVFMIVGGLHYAVVGTWGPVYRVFPK
jgi:hypothetical protein